MPENNTNFPAIRAALAELDVQRCAFIYERQYLAVRAIYTAAMKELAGVEQLREALEKLRKAEWMVTVDWTGQSKRDEVLAIADAALAATAPAKGAK